MRTFLGLLMAFVVSGETDVTIEGTFGDKVLLQCNCLDRNMSKGVKWQMVKPIEEIVHDGTVSYSRFKGRATMFVSEDNYNCSLLLTNITTKDHGEYRCIFYMQEKYTYFPLHLNISANYKVCQRKTVNGDSSRKVFQCAVQGSYKEAEIQWFLNETLLSNSPVTNITHTYSEGHLNGLYSFKSELITQLNWASEPKCKVKAEGISSKTDECEETTNAARNEDHPEKFSIIVIIPIVLVLGVSFFLWYKWKFSQCSQKVTKVKTDDY